MDPCGALCQRQHELPFKHCPKDTRDFTDFMDLMDFMDLFITCNLPKANVTCNL